MEERGFYLGQVCEVIKNKKAIVSQVAQMEAGLAKFEKSIEPLGPPD